MKLETKAQGLHGSLRIPGDKSISHRSILSLISFLSIDIQAVSLVIYARFLYHYGITTLSLAI